MIEGVGFMPSQVAGLPASIERRACFVGMSTVNAADIDIHTGANDWHRGLSDEDAGRLPSWIGEWSRIIERECQVHAIPYVDLSGDWRAGAVRVATVLGAA
jgi:hypothetical protein